MLRERPDDAPTASDSLVEAPGSTFSEPWQARAFAIAILASRQGCFTWSEWTQALSHELQGASDAAYFDCWLTVLQSLLVGKGAVGQGELSQRKRAWEDAYHRTPHGAPVKLSAP
jgi:nitrile hydratase accessory protein